MCKCGRGRSEGQTAGGHPKASETLGLMWRSQRIWRVSSQENPCASHPESPSQWENASGGAEPTALPLLGRLGARQVPRLPLARTCEGVQSSPSLTLPTCLSRSRKRVVQGGERRMIPPQEAEAGGHGQARLLANTLTRSEDSVRPES